MEYKALMKAMDLLKKHTRVHILIKFIYNFNNLQLQTGIPARTTSLIGGRT